MQHWSREHIAALVATAVVAGLLVAGARRWGEDWTRPVGRGLAVVILAGFVGEQLTYATRGEWTARVNLPLQLTDVVTLASIAALWRPRSALLVELVYFWAFSASLQAVLTPDLGQSFPDVLFFTYFATHSGAIAAASLLVLGAGRAPRPDAVWRVYGVTAAVLVAAGVGTLLTGGNYMFLRHKPVHGSLLDLMGPWPSTSSSPRSSPSSCSSRSRDWPASPPRPAAGPPSHHATAPGSLAARAKQHSVAGRRRTACRRNARALTRVDAVAEGK